MRTCAMSPSLKLKGLRPITSDRTTSNKLTIGAVASINPSANLSRVRILILRAERIKNCLSDEICLLDVAPFCNVLPGSRTVGTFSAAILSLSGMAT